MQVEKFERFKGCVEKIRVVLDTKDGVGITLSDGWTTDALLDFYIDFFEYIDAVN